MKPQRQLIVLGSGFLTRSSSTEERRLFLLVSEKQRGAVVSSKSVLALALSGWKHKGLKQSATPSADPLPVSGYWADLCLMST